MHNIDLLATVCEQGYRRKIGVAMFYLHRPIVVSPWNTTETSLTTQAWQKRENLTLYVVTYIMPNSLLRLRFIQHGGRVDIGGKK